MIDSGKAESSAAQWRAIACPEAARDGGTETTKADGRFYPDFLCQPPGKDNEPGPILAVEYKGADRWAAVEDDRLIGGLWANLSGGRCRFVMVKDKRWESIEGCF